MDPVQLANAKSQYHLLVTGQLPRVVLDGNDGSRLEFQGANADALLAYIRAADPTFLIDPIAAGYTNRPIMFTF